MIYTTLRSDSREREILDKRYWPAVSSVSYLRVPRKLNLDREINFRPVAPNSSVAEDVSSRDFIPLTRPNLVSIHGESLNWNAGRHR